MRRLTWVISLMKSCADLARTGYPREFGTNEDAGRKMYRVGSADHRERFGILLGRGAVRSRAAGEEASGNISTEKTKEAVTDSIDDVQARSKTGETEGAKHTYSEKASDYNHTKSE